MNVFFSWSGGKDCMLALHRTLQNGEHRLLALLNMCDRDTNFSRSHGLKKELLQRQAEAMNVRLVQRGTSRGEYERDFKLAIAELKKEGLEGGVFGDIYLIEHRSWIERVCADMGIQAIFPLWGDSTDLLATELVDAGFEPLVVSVHADHLPQNFLGRTFNQEMINDLQHLDGIDICAENGEFHSFVVNGPVFKHPVAYEKGEVYFKGKHWFLELN